MLGDLALGDVGRGLWEPALPHLDLALRGEDGAFLGAVEHVARSAGLGQRIPIAAICDAFSEGCEKLRERLAPTQPDPAAASRRLYELERLAAARIAVAYSEGLQETIAQMRRAAEESSPMDVDSGAMKPRELLGRLELEVNRCRRMDLPLGLLELGIDGGDGPAETSGAAPREIGDCLRGNLRRYDSVGLSDDGAFVLVLPDISRRGLEGAAERLRRELCDRGGGLPAAEYVFALAHYEFVDMNAPQMLASLRSAIRRGRDEHQRLTWS